VILSGDHLPELPKTRHGGEITWLLLACLSSSEVAVDAAILWSKGEKLSSCPSDQQRALEMSSGRCCAPAGGVTGSPGFGVVVGWADYGRRPQTRFPK
jgi:hypothetical protein